MSITIIESGVSSQSGSAPTREQNYIVLGAAGISEAEAALISGTSVTKPSGWSGFPQVIGSLVADTLDVTMHGASESTFEASVGYKKAKRPDPPETNAEEVSFDISSQTIKVTQSKETISKTAASGDAPDFKGGVGFDGEKFQGADVMVEAFSFSITLYKPIAQITNAYIQTLRNAAFRTNTDTFKGMAPGECLFVGASGSKRNEDDYAIAHKFMAVKNATGLSVGDITGISKKGWEYMWALYENEEDDTAKKVTPRPTAAYVERLYDSIAFASTLGLTA